MFKIMYTYILDHPIIQSIFLLASVMGEKAEMLDHPTGPIVNRLSYTDWTSGTQTG